ncbi:MAG: hypothetical protein LBO71_01745 [Prevotellaceae bacterium]|jgi:hypothetical protein|nr:hypothetical protein [Prevotellaceae bacterium]
MIKLDIPAKPTELTDKLTSKLTLEFRNAQKPVWKIGWLQKQNEMVNERKIQH